jgi:tRNA modification GTPase
VIVAVATPPGRGALAVVRLTGPRVADLVARFARLRTDLPLKPNRVRRIDVFDGDGVFDDGMLIFGEGPRTETGEDYAELGLHGNPLIVQRTLRAALDAGARLAEPGEFTRRAWENGKLDLVEAEAVLQVAEAATARGLALARDAASGRISARLSELRGALVEVAADLEARLDYPADELAFLDDGEILRRLGSVSAECRALAATESVGRVLVHGARVALIGPVNAGKSSLFNALLGRKRALVHETPGTTRDVLEVAGNVGGAPVTLLDTAGERETADPIEAAGLALARELVEEADLLVLVLRARSDGPDETERAILERTAGRPRVLVYNGVDRPSAPAPEGAIRTVATSGEGVPELARAIATALVGEPTAGDRLLIASARQRDLLLAVADAADEAAGALPLAGPAVAADAVTRGLAELDSLTGADTREDVLDALFARFCIGK